MNLSLYIARRYLFSKKSHQVINIISGVAISGVALATIAMVCTLSVFNGFQKLVEMQFTSFNPELKISASHGKMFEADSALCSKIASLSGVSVMTRSLEDKAMVEHGGRQVMVTLKGVEENFVKLTDFESVLFGSGTFKLADSLANYAIPGGGLISTINSGIYYTRPLEIYAPRRGRKVSMTNPMANFKKGYMHSSGLMFAMQQPQYDNNYIVTSIDFTRTIFERKSTEVSSIELRMSPDADIKKVKKLIKEIMGDGYTVHDRYEQQEDIFRVMKIEKFISYIFLTFILLIACFNIIGSLSMLILEKRQDALTLRSLGAGNKLITDIFVFEGCLISGIGAVSGIVIGLLICLAQQHLGLLSLGEGNGSFVVDSYPVSVEWADVLLVFVTVLVVGIISVAFPVRMLTHRMLGSMKP